MGPQKGREKRVNGDARLRAFGWSVIVMVVIVAAVGLYVAGSPGTQRERKFDEQRLSDLQEISSAIDLYYSRKGMIPQDLGMLAAQSDSAYMVRSATDPVTGEPYGYEPVDSNDYRLCATFDQPTPEDDPTVSRPVPVFVDKSAPFARDWTHPAGEHCFSLTASDQMNRTACGGRAYCEAGQTCAVLPGENDAYCVPQGSECIAAGCPGQCEMLESYPVQVRCPGMEGNANGCTLMQNRNTDEVDCFGCADGICKDPTTGWGPYASPEIGIPYACFHSGNGCELAQ